MAIAFGLTVVLDIPPLDTFPETLEFDVMALRHNTLMVDEVAVPAVSAVTVNTQPARGRVIAQDNGTLVINMDGDDYTASTETFNITVTEDGVNRDCNVTINVLESTQRKGWRKGAANMHPLDPATGKWEFLEPEDFKTWYIDAPNGMTIADIATDAGETQGTITGAWLISQYPAYGGSEATALALDAARELNGGLPARVTSKFLFKRGTDVSADDETGIQAKFGKSGISAVYPTIIGSYGTGAKPLMPRQNYTGHNAGFRSLESVQFYGIGSHRLEGAGPCFTLNMVDHEYCEEMLLSNVPGATVTASKFLDITTLGAPQGVEEGNDPNWLDSVKNNRESAIYVNNCDSITLMGNIVDRGGYDSVNAYDPGAQYNDGANGLPPNLYSHDIYMQYTNNDVTFEGNVMSEAASVSAQVRTGGDIGWNASIANPIGLADNGNGNSDEIDPITEKPLFKNASGWGEFTFHTMNVTTQGYEHSPSMSVNGPDGGVYTNEETGAWRWGNTLANHHAAVYGDMIVHHNDPNDPSDTEPPKEKPIRRNTSPVEFSASTADDDAADDNLGKGPLAEGSFINTTGWPDPKNEANSLATDTGGVDEAVFSDYTVQRYADFVLNTTPGTSTYRDLIDHYRSLDNPGEEGRKFCEWMAAGLAAAGDSRFAIPAKRTVAQTVKAQLEQNGMTSGKWWKNFLDWDTKDYPGTVDYDSADLQGHRMMIAIKKALLLTDLHLGAGGAARISGSSVNVTGALTAVGYGNIGTLFAGRFAFNGYTGSAKITAATEGGLLVNLGSISGNMDVLAKPQEFDTEDLGREFLNTGHVMLCTGGETVVFGSGDTLEVQGYSDVAFDGPSGAASVVFEAGSLLRFSPRGTTHENNPMKFGEIRNKQTGWFGNVAPGITSGITFNGPDVEVDVTDMDAGVYTVADVDSITGSFGSVTVTGGSGSAAIVNNTIEITVL